MEPTKELAECPTCYKCGTYMELRGKTGYATPEQEFCGIWYDHPQTNSGTFGHTASILLPSEQLRAQEQEFLAASGALFPALAAA